MDLGTMIMMTVLVMIMVWIEIVKRDNTWVSLYWQPGRAGTSACAAGQKFWV